MPRTTKKIDPKKIENAKAIFKGYIDKHIEKCRELSELYVKHPTIEGLEPELKYIFRVRLSARLIWFIKLYIGACLEIDAPDNSFYTKVSPFDVEEKIADDQLRIFLEEILKKGIKEILAKAISGDKRSVYKLVLWEKTSISLKFVVERLAMASLNGDREFIEKLADALKQKVYDKREERNKHYVDLLRFMIPFFKVKYGWNARKVWKKMNENKRGSLSMSDIIIEDFFKGEGVPSLDDYGYYIKVLKRKNILP